MMYTVEKLRKMRVAAREKVLTENPELRAEWEKAQAERAENPVKPITEEEMRKQDREYLYNFGENR